MSGERKGLGSNLLMEWRRNKLADHGKTNTKEEKRGSQIPFFYNKA